MSYEFEDGPAKIWLATDGIEWRVVNRNEPETPQWAYVPAARIAALEAELADKKRTVGMLNHLCAGHEGVIADLTDANAKLREVLRWIDEELKDGTRTDFKRVIRDRIARALAAAGGAE